MLKNKCAASLCMSISYIDHLADVLATRDHIPTPFILLKQSSDPS